MTNGDREARVLGAVVALVDNLLHDFDVVDLLTDLTERCADLLDISSAGLLLADPRGQLHLMAATSDRTVGLELFQLQADEGPCLDCYVSGEPISIADLDTETGHWPRFVPAAREAGFASVHAVPLRAAGSVLGALGLFGTSTGALNDADLLVGRSLAHVASVAIVQERPPTPETVLPRLRRALASRVVVEQAKGFLRERLDTSLTDAFTLLRQYAHHHDVHVSEVARRLMTRPDARPTIIAGLLELAEASGNEIRRTS
ncbi:ANTAR domain-containing protein [Friedmanniella luteola]|uniref:ANTAR domain-containing protein n=1 Tax=Friedmanniella luteola TaxID=546871 RepID=A0A1H1WM18_9ACTN|nr:GAF and ANTAR domain-containing protein [Friedmanniella luteola]SDS98062.1 ANTAR domain-containing protein [Friedmanniella luteola]